ncbi:hypothetical protein DRQ50_13205, partial [bacterium]
MLALLLSGCSDDDPTAPAVARDFTDAASAVVTLHVLGVFEIVDTVEIEWRDIGTRETPGAYDEGLRTFLGERDSSTARTHLTDEIALYLNSSTDELDSLFCSSGYSSTGGGSFKSVKAARVPLVSYDRTDSVMTAVWRLDGMAALAAIDTVRSTAGGHGYHSTMLTWSADGS